MSLRDPEWLAMRADDLRNVAAAMQRLDGPGIIGLAVGYTHTQADLARLSGIAPNTLTAIKAGKRPTAAHRAAILWAITRALGIA